MQLSRDASERRFGIDVEVSPSDGAMARIGKGQGADRSAAA